MANPKAGHTNLYTTRTRFKFELRRSPLVWLARIFHGPADLQFGKELAKIVFDARQVHFIEENQAVLRPLFPGDAWTEFAQLIQSYSFADAQTQLDQALKQLT